MSRLGLHRGSLSTLVASDEISELVIGVRPVCPSSHAENISACLFVSSPSSGDKYFVMAYPVIVLVGLYMVPSVE